MGVHGRSGVAVLTLVSLLVLTGPGPGTLAQSPDPSLFALPAEVDLPAAATLTVDDTPATLRGEIDLTQVIETAFDHLDSLPSEAWEVGGLAPTLADPVAAFELVRDSIRFDPYPGVLRGAEGTLTARGGNAFDRATLLKALLDAQGATTRFAFGQLQPDVAAVLVTHALDAPARPLPTADFSPFDAAFDAAIDSRARRDYALLSKALSKRLSGLDADGTATATAEVARHAWVQIQQVDGTWLDLDPSLPDSQPGETLTTAATISDVLPDDARQTVTIRVIAETLQDGALSESTVLATRLDPSVAADQQVLVTFTPDTGTSGGGLLGNGVGGVLGGGGGQGEGAYLPILMIDGDTWSGEPVRLFTSGGGGGLLGGGGSPQDLASLSLEIETDAPGLGSQVARHVIADRVPAESRTAGSLGPDDLLPVDVTDGTPAMFSSILHVMLSTGGSSPRSYAWQQGLATQTTAVEANRPSSGDTGLAVAFAPLGVADATLVVASEQRVMPALDDSEVRAIVHPPSGLSRQVGAGPDRPIPDRCHDRFCSSTRSGRFRGLGPQRTRQPAISSGTEPCRPRSRRSTRSGMAWPSNRARWRSREVSFEMDEPLTVLSVDELGDLPAGSAVGLATMLAAGDLAVVPGDPGLAKTWWQVSQDGTTRSILAPTLGGVGGVGRPAGFGGPRSRP